MSRPGRCSARPKVAEDGKIHLPREYVVGRGILSPKHPFRPQLGYRYYWGVNFTNPAPGHEADATGTAVGSAPSTRLAFVSGVARALDARCAVRQGDHLVLAVSGGADSMALLLAMVALARRTHRRYELIVAHVNHHLRPEADAEARSVRATAAHLGVECVVCDVRPAAAGGNLAATARAMRYEALAAVARERLGAGIVTAHHGTDQLETFMMSLLRGAGLDGLAALAWRANRWGVDIIRPLLDQTHDDCVALCRRCGWSWSEDASNHDETKRRNAIRARLGPLLLELAPDFDRRIHRTADLMRHASLLVQREAAAVFVPDATGAFDRAALARAGELVIGAGLRDAAASLGSPRDELTQEVVRGAVDAIMQVAVRRPRRFDWPGGVMVEVRSRQVRLSGSRNR